MPHYFEKERRYHTLHEGIRIKKMQQEKYLHMYIHVYIHIYIHIYIYTCVYVCGYQGISGCRAFLLFPSNDLYYYFTTLFCYCT